MQNSHKAAKTVPKLLPSSSNTTSNIFSNIATVIPNMKKHKSLKLDNHIFFNKNGK